MEIYNILTFFFIRPQDVDNSILRDIICRSVPILDAIGETRYEKHKKYQCHPCESRDPRFGIVWILDQVRNDKEDIIMRQIL